MPRRAMHVVRWNARTLAYEACAGPDHLDLTLDSPDWFSWLDTVSSFAFESRAGGSCTIRKETVQRGGEYWYAYRRIDGRMAKRYLGRAAGLTLSRLEEVSASLDVLARAGIPSARDAAARTRSRPARKAPAQSAARDAPSASLTAAGSGSAHLLLATKLTVPPAPARLVERPHVLQRLQRGLERPLTLISAPAGSGKTTALRAWLHDLHELPVAWVALDAADNDPLRFWAYVCAALDRADPSESAPSGVATTAFAMLHTPRPPALSTIVRALLNDLAALARPLVLVLDDLHVITEPEIHATLATLLEHPPAQLHLFIATRTTPAFPLARLRAYDQLNEIRADDLRFRPDEAAAFLGEIMGVELAADEVMRLAERTDGWIAGLQLAGLSLQHHPDPARFVASFGGSHRHVLRYLGEEVFAAQPEELRAFLLRTAILDRLCGPLCDAVTGRDDGQAMLERLEQANLFLMPLDDDGHWYRYHHLFADLLRHLLAQEREIDGVDLHQRAARWLEDEGWLVEAVEHLLAAGEVVRAAELIERSAPELLMRGDAGAFLRLIERLPEDAISVRPRLALYLVSAFFFVGRLEEAEQRIAQVEHWLATASGREREAACPGEDETRWLTGEVAARKATLAVMRGDALAAISFAEVARTCVGADEAAFFGAAGLPLGIAYVHSGQVRAADMTLAEVSRVCLAQGNLAGAAIALGMRGHVLMQRGQLREAERVCRQVIALAEERGGASRSMAGSAYAGLGEVLYERNDLAAARLAFEKAIALGEQWDNGQGDEVDGYARLAFVYQAQGQSLEASEAMRRAVGLLEELAQAKMTFPWMPPYVLAAGARLALRQGRIDLAERWAHERGLAGALHSPRHEYPPDTYHMAFYEPPGTKRVAPASRRLWSRAAIRDVSSENSYQPQEFEFLTLVRILIARGEPQEAACVLDRLLTTAQAEERHGSRIEIHALLALASQAQGDTLQALEHLERSLALAMSEGYVRVFADEGMPLRGLLARLHARQPRGSELRRYIEALLGAFDHARVPAAAPTAPGQLLAEPLSARELEVLRLLAKGSSNAEIARQLVVASSTVKTHLHHIFAKLQANDRLQAVARARELGIFDHAV